MTWNIDRELQLFEESINYLKLSPHSPLEVQNLAPWIFILTPKAPSSASKGESAVGKIPLTIMGLVHGNEVASLRVLNELLLSLKAEVIQLPFMVGVVLGNVEAAKKNVRFIERDLNRCFQKDRSSEVEQTEEKLEEKRAREIEKILQKSAHLIDLHQTQTPSLRSFFVLHYTQKAYEYIRSIDPTRAIVCFPDGMKRKVDLTATIYAQHWGGVAATLELGEMGFHPGQVADGLRVIHNLLRRLTQSTFSSYDIPEKEGELFVVTERIVVPEGEEGVLLFDFANFTEVKKGQIFARIGDKEVSAKEDGVIIFGKAPAGKKKVKMEANEPIGLFAVKREKI